MTNPAYEATNSDVEKLIKYARINAECGEHTSPGETLKLVAALQREVDIRAQNLSIKLHMAERIAELEKTLRGAEESLIAAVDQVAELESQPLCVKLPDSSSKAFWSGIGKTEQFHPETYKRWVKEAIERAGDIAGIKVEVK